MLLEVQEVCVSLSLFCVFYFFKSISVKVPLSPVSFVDRPGSGARGSGREGEEEGGLVVERRTEVERKEGEQ